jgi:pyruvate formate lyase activating enzyme
MADELKGVVFNIQKFSVQDGPGIRTTVFMKGCLLKCPWCSNPEGMRFVSEIMANDRKCIGCKKCVEVCPVNAISTDDTIRTIDWNLCINCLECAKVCPSHSIEIVGRHMTVDEVFKIVARDMPFYRNTSGGATVSGGEPLQQWQWVLEFFKTCKQEGLHTALDTTGYCKWEHMRRVLKYVDLILFDIKHMDSERCKETCGVSNELILENLVKAARICTIWLRVPLIPSYNDSETNLRMIAEIASKVVVDKVSLLPYHEYGKQKYKCLGREYCFNQAAILKPDDETVIRSKALLESYGLEVTVGA